jgi:uncharacterized SAM-binding protein YcdF (DUF218 family)
MINFQNNQNELEIYMNNPIKFSIIVTSYNQQSYISACIQSVKNQTYPFFECIIVDDGSSDNTLPIIQNEIKDDSRFKLITQQNQGVSFARNAALSHIHGDFVSFLDGDDELGLDCLKKCSHYIENNDLLIFGITNIYYKNNIETHRVESAPYVADFINGKELARWYIKYHAILLYSCGNKMYRVSTIRKNGLCFNNEFNWGEDRLFNYQFLAHCKGIRSVRDSFYLYKHMNEQSLTSSFRMHHIDTLLKLHALKMEYLLPLATGTSLVEMAEFRQYDIRKEVCNAFLHIADHAQKLPQKVLEEEYSYLNAVGLPAYFYDAVNNTIVGAEDGLIHWITQKVYSAVEDRETLKPDVVIILGSRSCEYRVEAAMKQFGHLPDIIFICSGGNRSQYLDEDGKELIEADYMHDYLLDHGIDEAFIMTERDSHNTYENIKKSLELCHKLSFQKRKITYTIVTAGFHKARVQQILCNLNYEINVIPVDGPNTYKNGWYKNQIGINAVFSELMR